MKKEIFARTFGHFDLFVDGSPIIFKSTKAKELLAYLIDRQGGTVTTDQIISVLWENRPNDVHTQNLCSKVVRCLKKELKANDLSSLLVSYRGTRYVDVNLLKCDYLDMLKGDREAIRHYTGEYMIDYSWAENRIPILNQLYRNYNNNYAG